MCYAMAKVAAKILSGEENNTRKWKCVEDLGPNEEGASKTLRKIEQYMLSFGGSFLIWRHIFNAPISGCCFLHRSAFWQVFYYVIHFDIFFSFELRTPEEADMRYAMAKVAAKILSGEENNTQKWKCVEDLAPNEEGAPKTNWRQIFNSLPFPDVVFFTAQKF